MDLYLWNMNKISTDILTYLSQITLKNKDCVVFDIDETLIDLKGDVIQPIIDIYNYVKKKKVQ